jgi:hypothetical protein
MTEKFMQVHVIAKKTEEKWRNLLFLFISIIVRYKKKWGVILLYEDSIPIVL